ncbi:putative glucose-1-phosphate adenylyltransferase [Helianthus annuus]|uniref:Glucose-1-phosphate adenylyltransferase n=2 Tax=Helianthus annuus TaxID=4232 RepID=A0A9K3J4H8_HELAN|nr:putative glucose-1-phosphate adenylyltransferase [Helianthus annuus]KAJ0586592.1 putative glucose-1-phosphate adenylyltransferase [Helianthus annuus]KAJ0595305.1 putative glucose-1-phosphate adenylyltransferase [Helianthus annuus]KAJ0755988.1 putative glucose-1-phosphate adenylyltransferase [Helianthus annuus]KAJ0759771.1 putative glucose-1-phosphate adenylyltransferase [Helianthus annuus]
MLRAYASNMSGYKNEGFVEVLAAQQSPENTDWFQGTADAVRQYLWLIEEQNVLEFLVFAGDHLYRTDYEKFIQAHRVSDADITVAALPMDEKRATAFGLMKIEKEGRIIEFSKKPKGEKLQAMKVDTSILGLDDKRAKKCRLLQVQAYLYDGYWEDIGTIEAFYHANLGITKKPVPDFRSACYTTYNKLVKSAA